VDLVDAGETGEVGGDLEAERVGLPPSTTGRS
jgi:hypothetical protein